jgi:hypothetical protein
MQEMQRNLHCEKINHIKSCPLDISNQGTIQYTYPELRNQQIEETLDFI